MSAKGTKWSEERKNAWAEKCRLTNVNNKGKVKSTPEEKELKRLRSIEHNKKYWTPERKAEHSALMKQKVLENPDSYAKANVSGRVKIYDVVDSYGPTKVKGTWELQVAEWLNNNNIKWTNKIEPYKYYWNQSWHLYFPDFLLIESNMLIEVKGYETDRDHAKWASVNRKLIVLKRKDMLSLEKSIAGRVVTTSVS